MNHLVKKLIQYAKLSKKILEHKLFRIFLSILFIFLLYRHTNFERFYSYLKTIDTKFLVVTFLLVGSNYFFSSFRWRALIFYSDKFKGLKVFKLMSLYLKGAFFNNFMPSSIGGDVYKVYALAKITGENAKSVAATFMDRLTGLILLAFLSSVSMVLLWGLKGLGIFISFWVLIGVGFLVLNIASRFSKKLKSVEESIHVYRHKKMILAESMVFSLGVQVVANLAPYFSARAMGVNMPLTYALFSFPVIGFLSFLPLSFNGVGIQDFLYVKFFTPLGYLPEQLLAASFVYHILRILVSLLGGLLIFIDNLKTSSK